MHPGQSPLPLQTHKRPSRLTFVVPLGLLQSLQATAPIGVPSKQGLYVPPYFWQMGPRQTGLDGILQTMCVRLDMPRHAAYEGRGMGPGQLGEGSPEVCQRCLSETVRSEGCLKGP